MKSLFIVIEGVDLSGKTSLIEKLKISLPKNQEINSLFKEIIYTREDGSHYIPFCLKIRELTTNKDYKLNNKSMALLFMANRSEHIQKLVKPALERNSLVICDRFYISTLIYQGQQIQENINWIKMTQKFVANIVPDATFLINISEETFNQRYKERKTNLNNDPLDDYAKEQFSKIKNIYENLEKTEPKEEIGPIFQIDGGRDVNETIDEITKKIINLAKNK